MNKRHIPIQHIEEIQKKSATFRRFFWCKSSTFQEEGNCYMEGVIFSDGTVVKCFDNQVVVHHLDSWEHAHSTMHSFDSHADGSASPIWLDEGKEIDCEAMGIEAQPAGDLALSLLLAAMNDASSAIDEAVKMVEATAKE